MSNTSNADKSSDTNKSDDDANCNNEINNTLQAVSKIIANDPANGIAVVLVHADGLMSSTSVLKDQSMRPAMIGAMMIGMMRIVAKELQEVSKAEFVAACQKAAAMQESVDATKQ